MGTFAKGCSFAHFGFAFFFQVCSRGLDIKDVTHVVNLDMVPWRVEDLGNNCMREIHRPQICINLLYMLYVNIYKLKIGTFFSKHQQQHQQHVGMSY